MVWHEPAESRVLDEPADPQRGESKQMSDVDREVTVHAATGRGGGLRGGT